MCILRSIELSNVNRVQTAKLSGKTEANISYGHGPRKKILLIFSLKKSVSLHSKLALILYSEIHVHTPAEKLNFGSRRDNKF